MISTIKDIFSRSCQAEFYVAILRFKIRRSKFVLFVLILGNNCLQYILLWNENA